jgi:peptide/nickel transport system substrate-binding protein
MGAEPDTIFVYGGAMHAKSNVLEAIYDGPIDTNGYDFQPVILEKLPSLADGDARIEPVSVSATDRVVDDAGEVVLLAIGEKVRPYGCTRPDCAEVWDGGPLEMAQLSADFSLLEGLRWSDGEPLTARDSFFGYSIARACRDTGGCDYFGMPLPMEYRTHEHTASYSILNERTTRWTGLPGFLDPQYAVNFFFPLPEHQLRGIAPQEMDDHELTTRKPLGWGPYIIENYAFGDRITLSRNPYYFRAAEGLPRFDRLVYSFVGNDLTKNIASLVSGECDLLDIEAVLGDDLGSQLLLDMDAEGLLQAHVTTVRSWEHADFSLGHADYDDGYQPGRDRPDLFGDPRTRQAIAHCIDRQRLVDELLYGRSRVMHSYLPEEHPLFNPDVPRYGFNISRGSELFEEAGWRDLDGDPDTPRTAQGVPNVPEGTPLSFRYWTTEASVRQKIVPILQETLARCGVRLEVQYFPAAEFFADPPEGDLFSRRFDMAEFAWLTGTLPPCDLFTSENIPGDPEVLNPDGSPRFPKGWEGQNNPGYSDPEFDEACQAAREALPGGPGYEEKHQRAQQIFADELPVIPLFQNLWVTAARADFCGHQMDPTADSDTWNIEEYDFGEGCEEP